MQESSETRDLEKPTRPAYFVSFALNSFQTTDQTENNNERLAHDHNSAFTAPANIPDEIALFIFEYLDLKNLFTASCVNKKWLQLASDRRILNQFIDQYSQGNLWHFLSKKPDTSSYQTYFHEVFEGIADYSLFTILSFNSLRDNFIIDNRPFFEKYRKVREDFFESLIGLSDHKLLLQALSDTKDTLSILSTTKTNETMSLVQFKRIISLLMHINSIDASLTDYTFIKHYVMTKANWSIAWFADSKKNKLLSGKAIVTLMALLGLKVIELIYNQGLGYLINKLKEADIFKIIELNFHATEIFIKDPLIIHKLSDEGLIAITKSLPLSKRQEYFYDAVENNPTYYSRWDGDLLVKLGNENNKLSFLILNHPRLLQLLTEDQYITIASNLNTTNTLALLDKETLWNFKVVNRRKFLLRFPYLDSVISHNRVIALFSPEDFLPLKGYEKLTIAMALAKQNIFLQKLNAKQLLQLSLYHPNVAMELLNNKTIIHRWTEDLLSKLERELGDSDKEVTVNIHSVRKWRSEEQQKKRNAELLVSLIQPLQERPQITLIKIISDSRVIKPNPSIDNPPTFKKEEVNKVNVGAILALIFIGVLSTALLATGIGGLLGVGIIVTALTALNFLNLSINAFSIACLIAGGLSLLPVIPPLFTSIKNKLKIAFSSNPLSKNAENKFRIRSSYRDLTNKFLSQSVEDSPKNHKQFNNHPSDYHPSLFVNKTSTSEPQLEESSSLSISNENFLLTT